MMLRMKNDDVEEEEEEDDDVDADEVWEKCRPPEPRRTPCARLSNQNAHFTREPLNTKNMGKMIGPGVSTLIKRRPSPLPLL